VQLFEWVFLAFVLIFVMVALWLYISMFLDLIRRREMGNGRKVAWALFMLLLPILGCLVYLVARPVVEPRASSHSAIDAAAGGDAGGDVGAPATEDELSRLSRLRDSGEITAEEYEARKPRPVP
jgi:hypothetical protein